MMKIEPTLEVSTKLAPILKELQALEPLFHAAYKEATPEMFEALVAPEFWEVGASGRLYSRAFVLSVLNQREKAPDEAAWQTKDFHVTELAENNYLLTYSLMQPGRTTRRLTVWRKYESGWKAVYHQGTVVEAP